MQAASACCEPQAAGFRARPTQWRHGEGALSCRGLVLVSAGRLSSQTAGHLGPPATAGRIADGPAPATLPGIDCRSCGRPAAALTCLRATRAPPTFTAQGAAHTATMVASSYAKWGKEQGITALLCWWKEGDEPGSHRGWRPPLCVRASTCVDMRSRPAGGSRAWNVG